MSGIAEFSRLLARATLIVLGLLGAAWGAVMLPAFWRQMSITPVVSQIIDAKPVAASVLSDRLKAADLSSEGELCFPAALRGAAIIRLRVVENALGSGERSHLDEDFDALSQSLRKSLACAPSDSYLWLILFWLESTRHGFNPAELDYLRMSYRLGANEGWISLKRNRLGFAIFEGLPADLRDAVISEFVSLLNSELYQPALEIMTGSAWRLRDVIVPNLTRVNIRKREIFSQELQKQGFSIEMPGIRIRPPDERPWK